MTTMIFISLAKAAPGGNGAVARIHRLLTQGDFLCFKEVVDLKAAMSTKGPKLIEAQIVQDLQRMTDAIHKSRGWAEDHTKQ
jgi:hypothetical protein